MDVNGINIDPSSSPELGVLTQQGRATNADTAHSYMQGTEAGRGLLNQPDTFNQGLAYGNPMGAAIKQRATNDFNLKSSELNNRVLRAASEDRIRSLAETSKMANQEVMQNRQKEMLRNEIDQANKKARGAVLGAVLGIVGMGAGAYAGGPAGAQAGGNLGNATGNIWGGS